MIELIEVKDDDDDDNDDADDDVAGDIQLHFLCALFRINIDVIYIYIIVSK